MIKKTLTLLAVSCMMYSCATKTESNPFFAEFQTEYGVPSFDKIRLEHYEVREPLSPRAWDEGLHEPS